MAAKYEMKDSGVEWIGNFPNHWQLSDIGSLYILRNTKVSDKDFSPLSVTKKGILPQLETVAKTEDGDNRKLVKVGDFVINSRSDRRGSCGISPYDGSVSLINTVLAPRGAMYPGYYNWLFHTEQFADEFYKWGHGIVDDLWTTRWTEMKSIIVPIPSLNIQTAIASYLDDKCSAIDDVIAQAKETIEEYKSWKASVIFEAVTKGLDPNVEMKDSGVEWIGMVPKGWEVSRIKYHAHLMPKCDFSQLNGDTVITFTPMECIKNGTFENRAFRLGDINGSYTQYQEGDIVIAKVTPCFENGNCAIMQGLFSGIGLGSSELFVLRTRSVQTKFLFYFLKMPGFIEMGRSTMTGTGGLKRVASDAISNCPFPIPSFPEQTAIASYLDDKCSAIDSIISVKQVLIDELESYKKSLIFETVTGKRRVC